MSNTTVRPIIVLLISCALSALAGCGGGSSGIRNTADRTWTVLIYMAADNSLEQYGIQDINEMESAVQAPQVSILVQIDRKPGGDSSNGDWTTTRRYLIRQDSDTQVIGSDVLEDLGELNMANPATLMDFVLWGVERYAAENYLLVLWDHGRGWQSRALSLQPREVRSIHQDVTDGNAEMSLSDLECAMASLPHMNIVLFDACLMGMIEVAYAIRNQADIMIASEEEIPVEGQPYHSLVCRMATNPSIDAVSLASGIVTDYINYYKGYPGPCTLSALDLESFDELVSAVDAFAATMTVELDSWRETIRLAASLAQHFDSDSPSYTTYNDYRDLHDFASRVRSSVSAGDTRMAASDVMENVDRFVISERHAGDTVADSHGISIYLPTADHRSDILLDQYAGISFGRDTRWDEFLRHY